MTAAGRGPRVSIVSAVYDVEAYLPAFIASIENQQLEPDELEVVAVDDGSTDGSLDLLVDWAGRSRFKVKVYTKANGGQASARNLGLDHATGDWITFTDPDDMLDPACLAVAGRFASEHPELEILACKPVLLDERDGRQYDTHPRRRQYEPGNRVAALDDEPNVFPGSAAVSVFRRERVMSAGLRFDERVRPNFEDGHFTVRYLLALPRLDVGLLRDAVYVYRKRTTGSTLQQSLRDPRRYTDVLELGYLDVLDRARQRHGSVPAWLQHVLIYELSWYLVEDERITSNAHLPPELAPRFHALLRRILEQLEPEVVAGHRVRTLSPLWVDLLGHAGRSTPWHTPHAVRTRTDWRTGLRRVVYRFTGARPKESFAADEVKVEAVFAKTMAHRYYGADLMFERILWLPANGRLEMSLDGDPVRVVRHWPRAPGPGRWRTRWQRRIAQYRADPVGRVVRLVLRRVRHERARRAGAVLRRLARADPWRSRFAGAWLLIDRIHDADDNGERLFEHLRRERPDINAWFVLERDSPDWRRLQDAGETRLLAFGSFAWRMAMLNCAWLLSSHADMPIYRPPQLARTGPATWRFGFLQHGVIKDDLSRWLNQRELDLFVVSTEAEYDSVAGDGNAYRFSDREVVNTGLPRFDRLLAKGRAVPEPERNLVIIAPTWRSWLTLPLARGSQRRALDAAFWDSDYIRSWTDLLRSPAIAAALAARGWRLGFMPHPNLQGILGQLDLPGHVEPLAFAGTDVQDLYARCALLVTDYSSVVFNTAYLDRPAVYFQFDRDRMLGGAHVGRQGYFDYERDGFGPVATDPDAAVKAITAAIRHGASPTPEYQRRIDATFPVRDGGACARVVEAIEERSRPWSGIGGMTGPPAEPLAEATV